MIVDSMTYTEILEQFKKDIKIVMHKYEEGTKRYQKYVRSAKNKERVYYEPIRFKSACDFNYVVMFFNEGVNVPSKQRLGKTFYAWYIQKRGFYAITFSLLEKAVWHFTIYTPHFVDRYKLRVLKDMSISKADAFHQYIMKNMKVVSQKVKNPSEKYPEDYWTACNEGLCLCNQKEQLIIEVKTIISWDMLKPDQKEFAIEGKLHMLSKGFDLAFPEEDFNEYIEEENL